MNEIADILEIQDKLGFKNIKELFDDPRYPQIIEDCNKAKIDYKANPLCFTPSMLRLMMIENDNKFKHFEKG